MSRRSTAPGRPRPHHATCDTGLEALLARELSALPGLFDVQPLHRGVRFTSDREGLWRANLSSRLANRILLPLAQFRAANRAQLYAGAQRIQWSNWIAPGLSLSVDARGTNAQLRHVGFVAQVVKDALCDQLRAETGERPNIDREAADIVVNVHLDGEQCHLSLDASGARLHRRGWRAEAGPAPLKESLAAGLLMLAGWTPDQVLLDPMCGAGTLLIEAAGMAAQRAPGLTRLKRGGEGFAFERWRDHDVPRFEALVAELRAQERPVPANLLYGSDIDERSIGQAQRNLTRAGLEGSVRFQVAPISEVNAPHPQGLCVSNPPYAVRLGERDEVAQTYTALGDTLKQRFSGWTAWLLFAKEAPVKAIGLRPEQRIPLRNGPLPCELCSYRLYR